MLTDVYKFIKLVMKVKLFFLGISIVAYSMVALSSCEKKPVTETEFTKADSLTETYLTLQDTLLEIWNTMIYDDNRKIEAMNLLLHEMSDGNPEIRNELDPLKERLENLKPMRYDQHSMQDPEVVTEYDFASNSLITELISLAESQKEFAHNTTLQKLVDSIRASDQRVNNYREEYDQVASRFNRFVERNKAFLQDIEDDSTLARRPLFQMAAE